MTGTEQAEAPYPSVGDVLAEVILMRQDLARLTQKFDEAAGQINQIAELAGPAIEQLTASPVMRMLTGGGKRDKSKQ